ncbi:DinB family protein [Paenibacillus rhizoplanae]
MIRNYQLLKELEDGEGLLYTTTMTVNNLGKLDVYQYIYFLCQHAKRHIVQMQRVMDEYKEAERLGDLL